MALLFASLMLPGMLSAGDDRPAIPFKLYQDYVIVVQGSIGSVKGLNFVLDTGAMPSVVDARLAGKLRLAGRAEPVSVFNQNLQAQRVVLPVLQLGPIQAESLPVLVRNLSFVEEAYGFRVDALIGMDVLSRSSFRINYESRTVTFGPMETTESAIPFEKGLPFVVIRMQVEDQTVRLLVDTGAKDLVLFESRVQRRIPGIRVLGIKRSSNMGGEVQLKEVGLPQTRLGNTTLEPRKAFLLDTPADALPDFDGLLGVASLGVRRFEFDFERGTVNWRK